MAERARDIRMAGIEQVPRIPVKLEDVAGTLAQSTPILFCFFSVTFNSQSFSWDFRVLQCVRRLKEY